MNWIAQPTPQTIHITHDENGNVIKYIDSFGKETINTYDSQNHLVKSVTGDETTRFVYNGGDNLLQIIYPNQYNTDADNLDLTADTPVDTYGDSTVGDRYTYDDDGNILTYTNQFGEVTTNTYDADGNLTSTTKPDGTVFNFDEDGKAEKETYANGLIRDFTYTSNQTVIAGSHGITATYNLNGFGEVTEYKIQNGENNKNYSYTYDSDGNITSIWLNGSLQQTFTYNSSNELIRVDDAVANKTTTYGYDYVGNITAVKTYIYIRGSLGTPLTTQNYTYNSQNQRTDLSYDANGNLTSLNGCTFGWTNRRLTSATSTDNSISYTYNHNGIRTSKTIGGTTINYTVDENNNVIEQSDGTNTIKFVYDSNNSPIYMEYNGVTYYYEKNLQGDIVAILDADGNTVVEYSYDIWGKLLGITGELAGTLGIANPLRYRGYYYDNETELYYLQSRYYSPDLMRFISQDDPVLSNDQGQPLGGNLYAYCNNNPINFSDPTGESLTIILVCAGVGLIVGAVGGSHWAKHKKRLSPSDGWDYWKYVVGFGVVGGAVGALVGWGASALIAKYGVSTAATSITKGGGARFSSFNTLKRSLGSAGKGNQWHHIVEQCQINKSGFSKYWIHNSNNVINISNSVHSKVSAYYNSVQSFTNGMRFRNWLAGQNFVEQYKWGVKVLKMFGVKIK